MSFTKTNLNSGIWTTIRDAIEANLVDPKSRFKTRLVHSVRADPNSNNFCGYPYVILSPVNITDDVVQNDGDTTQFSVMLDFEILGTSYAELDEMTDALKLVFRTRTIQNSLLSEGLAGGKKLVDQDSGSTFINGKRLFFRTMQTSMMATMKVMS